MFKFLKNREMKKVLKEALSDGELTDDEIEEIGRRQDELGVSDEYIDEIRHKHFSNQLAPILKRIRSTSRYTPNDEEEIKTLCDKLKVTPSFEAEFTMYRKLWEIEETGTFEPTPIDVDIMLKKNEVCYHRCSSVWAQMKKYKKHTGYVGGSIGFRVAKGVTLRIGKAIPTSREYEELTDLSDGELYVTNKRLLYVGGQKSTNITYGRLVTYELFQDGIQIIKSSGKPDLFRLETADVEYVDALLQVMEA